MSSISGQSNDIKTRANFTKKIFYVIEQRFADFLHTQKKIKCEKLPNSSKTKFFFLLTNKNDTLATVAQLELWKRKCRFVSVIFRRMS